MHWKTLVVQIEAIGAGWTRDSCSFVRFSLIYTGSRRCVESLSSHLGQAPSTALPAHSPPPPALHAQPPASRPVCSPLRRRLASALLQAHSVCRPTSPAPPPGHRLDRTRAQMQASLCPEAGSVTPDYWDYSRRGALSRESPQRGQRGGAASSPDEAPSPRANHPNPPLSSAPGGASSSASPPPPSPPSPHNRCSTPSASARCPFVPPILPERRPRLLSPPPPPPTRTARPRPPAQAPRGCSRPPRPSTGSSKTASGASGSSWWGSIGDARPPPSPPHAHTRERTPSPFSRRRWRRSSGSRSTAT